MPDSRILKESSEILRDDRIMLSKDAFAYFILKIIFLIEMQSLQEMTSRRSCIALGLLCFLKGLTALSIVLCSLWGVPQLYTKNCDGNI